MRCHATVRQRGGQFSRGPHQHCHPGDVKLPVRVTISAAVKAKASCDLFRYATEIVEEVELQIPECLRFKKQKQSAVNRQINRFRTKTRPAEPSDVNFELDADFIGNDFVRADITADGQRHIVLATDMQLEILSKAKRWFMDGTFKVVRAPFRQLMSIHAFVERDGERKQFPLVFALMTRRQKTDYVRVLEAILDVTDRPAVVEVVMDFEKAAWQAMRDVLPEVRLKGCVFHWSKAVFRHLVDLGLKTTYQERGPMYDFVGQLMALPFLSSSHIEETFQLLRERASSPELHELTEYIAHQWINNTVFPVRSWSVFRYSVRTNNDVEGWHYRLNNKAGSPSLGLYRLTPLLKREAELTKLAVQSGDLERQQRRKTTLIENRLTTLWDEYMSGRVTTSKFLRRCSDVYRHIFE